MHTVVIRPTPLYGEGDSVFVPYAMRMARQWKGYQQIGHGDNVMQVTYAGNCAANGRKQRALQGSPCRRP